MLMECGWRLPEMRVIPPTCHASAHFRRQDDLAASIQRRASGLAAGFCAKLDLGPVAAMSTSPGAPFTQPLGQEILDKILSDVPNVILYHYTTQKGLLGIIKDKEIWATHHQCLHDTEEFIHAKGLFRSEIAKGAHADPLLEAMQHTLEGEGFEGVNLYVASLSADPDSLAQWRAYGGPTSGFSLGFGTDGIVLPSPFILARCIYKEDEQIERIRALVAEILGRLHQLPSEITADSRSVKPYIDLFTRSILHGFALTIKHPKFDTEKEWRIISFGAEMDDPPDTGEAPLDFREGKSTLVPYRRVRLRNDKDRFPLTDVVVGPSPSPEQSVRSVRSLLASHGLANCDLRRSDVPYRNW